MKRIALGFSAGGMFGFRSLVLFVLWVTSGTSIAANGECRWEGGPGNSGGHAYCEAEDCKGNGGRAECSRGEGMPAIPWWDSQVGPNKWMYHSCSATGGTIPHAAAWCHAAGGTWGNGMCTGLPAGVFGGGGTITNTESLAISISDTYISGLFPNATLVSDSGWGAAPAVPNCPGHPGTIYTMGIATREYRNRIFDTHGAPQPTTGIMIFRDRGARCPDGYKARTTSAGVVQCYRPAARVCSKIGNPIGNPTEPFSGAKLQTETDYRPSSLTGLEFTRNYNSLGYYRPTGLNIDGIEPHSEHLLSDHWRHSYDRRLYIVNGNAEIIAIGVRQDGTINSFGIDGKEQENRNGAGARLASLPDGTWKLTLADRSTELYGSSGWLQSIASPEGRVTVLTYDASGRLETVTGPFGHALQLDYDSLGRMWSLTLPGNGTIRYTYDNFDRLTGVTYPDSSQRQYHYEDAVHGWALTGISDEDGQRFATYTYDASGRVSVAEHAGGAERYQFAYGAGTTTITDPLGAQRTLTFANVGGIFKGVSSDLPGAGCGIVKASSFDANGNLASSTDFNDNHTHYAFDPERNVETSRTEAVGTADERSIITQYHPVFRLQSQIDEPGRQTNFSYDTSGNLLTRTNVDTATNQSRTWTYTYDSYGRVLTVDGPRTDVNDVTTYAYHECNYGAECGQVATITNAAGHTTSFLTYNAHGLPLTITDANNLLTTLTYDSRQRVLSRDVGGEVTSFDYHPTGLLERVTLPDGSYLNYSYDSAHRLAELEDAEGNRISYTLDAAGNRTLERIFDPSQALARTRGWVYDTLGRLLSEIDAGNNSIGYTYDSNGNVESSVDQEFRYTLFSYDALNRLRTILDPAGGLTQYAYTARDELHQVTDPRSLVTTYDYNGFGDTAQLGSPDTGNTHYTQNASGNVLQATDARGQTAIYTYDELDRITQIAYSDQTITFTYDQGGNGKGRLTDMTDAAGATTWTYSPHGRVTGKQQIIGSVSLAVGYTYNSAGQLIQLATPSGQSIGYTYSNGRVAAITVNGSTLLSNALYSAFGPTSGWTWGNSTLAVREYDLDGRITAIDSAGLSTYQYYSDGKVQTISEDSPGALSGPSGLTEFDVDTTSNRLDASTGLQVRSYDYDAAGNMLSDGTRTFTYNAAGRMVTASSGGVTATYAPNGLGQRVRKTISGQARYFVYDEAGQLIGEYNSAGGLIQETVWLDNIPVAVLKPNGTGVSVFYIHSDHLNTPRRISRPSDNVIVWRWTSDPFGATEADEDPDGNSVAFSYGLRFPGQYYDEETGLHYNYFRDYDPATGRYVQSDPIGLQGGSNTYQYAKADPIRYVDPRGLDPWIGGSSGGRIDFFVGGFGARTGFLVNSKTGEVCELTYRCLNLGLGVLVSLATEATINFMGPRCGRDLEGWGFSLTVDVVAPGAPGVSGSVDVSSAGIGAGVGPSGGVGAFGGASFCYARLISCQRTPCECQK